MALQLKVVLVVVRLRSPRARSIDVLSQCEKSQIDMPIIDDVLVGS
jgi:hypothetical protein